MTNETISIAAKTMTGISIVGEAAQALIFNKFNEPSIKRLTLILMGHYDENAKLAFYQIETGNTAKSIEEANTEEVIFALDSLKARIRRSFNSIIEAGAVEEKKRMLEIMKNTNKPNTQGTVAELATKYGVSKSEIRRMKTEGTLDSFIASKEEK